MIEYLVRHSKTVPSYDIGVISAIPSVMVRVSRAPFSRRQLCLAASIPRRHSAIRAPDVRHATPFHAIPATANCREPYNTLEGETPRRAVLFCLIENFRHISLYCLCINVRRTLVDDKILYDLNSCLRTINFEWLS